MNGIDAGLRRLCADDDTLGDILALLRSAFADIPASPTGLLTLDDLARKCAEGPAWVVERDGAPVACLFARPSREVPGALYIGSLAVAEAARGAGLARTLMEAAAEAARTGGHWALTLDTGAGLDHLHRMFGHLGFCIVSRTVEVVTMLRPLSRRLTPADDPAPVLALIRAAFAFMDGRIDPPSSMHRLTGADIARQAKDGAVWVIEEQGTPVACLFAKPQGDALYLGKLAVAESHRGRGLARYLVTAAAAEARARGLSALQLQTRIELTETHAAFARLGFARTGQTAHPGYDRPTSITMRRPVGRRPIGDTP